MHWSNVHLPRPEPTGGRYVIPYDRTGQRVSKLQSPSLKRKSQSTYCTVHLPTLLRYNLNELTPRAAAGTKLPKPKWLLTQPPQHIKNARQPETVANRLRLVLLLGSTGSPEASCFPLSLLQQPHSVHCKLHSRCYLAADKPR